LGLVVPPDCVMRVGDAQRSWRERDALLFDGSFEHEGWNRSDQTRWVLILDIWHPELNEAERRALARLSHLRRKERMVRRHAVAADRSAVRHLERTRLHQPI
jgi:aspartyl/asparaginyl beta-hydroxylase (cupin superfamily)